MNMERIVIAGYKPFEGKEKDLEELMKTHWDTLNGEGLVSARKPILMKAADGTILEVFGWKSAEAIEAAHINPTVKKMWAEYAEVCDYISVKDVPESHQLFSEFTPVE